MESIEQINLYIYLKGIRKPFHAVLSSEAQVDSFFALLSTDKVVKFGQIIFPISEFRYAKIIYRG